MIELLFGLRLPKLTFRTTTLAVLLSMFLIPIGSHAMNCKQNNYGDPNNQTYPSCNDRCFKQTNHVLYLRNNFPAFYNIVTHNGAKSCAHNDLCIKGILCFSFLANMDLLWADRVGTRAEGGTFSPGRLYGVGVRPLFGPYDMNVLGNINNLDLFVDGALNNWVTAHVDLAYVNAQRKVVSYADDAKDWGSVYRNAAAFKVNEAYFLLANPAVTPFYLQVGRFYSPFGYYTPYPITSPLTQLISEMRTGGVVLGMALPNGLYGSVYWTMSEQAIENLHGDVSTITGPNKDRNYGAKLGFQRCTQRGIYFNVNADYVADIRDADYMLEAYHYFNAVLRKRPSTQFLLQNQYIKMCRAAGMALHGEISYRGFGLKSNFVKALSGLNADPDVKSSKICAFDISGYTEFPTPFFSCPSRFSVSYQCADDAYVHQTFLGPLPPSQFLPFQLRVGNILPEQRFTATYGAKIFHNMKAYLQWVHDWDFCEGDIGGGTGRTSNFVVLRISGQY